MTRLDLILVFMLMLMATPARGDDLRDSVDQGKDVYRRNCFACHPVSIGEGHRIGPNLWGIVGRKVASLPGYPYSNGLKAWGKNAPWDMAMLDRFLASSAGQVPGIRMKYSGLPDTDLRQNLLAFLSTRSGSGASESDRDAVVMPLDWGGLPEGNGRKEVYFACQGCHSLMLVKQQRLNRRVWDETLRLMVSEKKMPEPSREAREKILDYLANNFGDATPRPSTLMTPPPLPVPPP
ncbi:MAG: c-type cytochrome [Magnetococcales bacterium]|nr:c-type cytochrome [Magnetococcales bacterium]MBF0322547.1 c-type cytochrome [Magnetococcales bacterium]